MFIIIINVDYHYHSHLVVSDSVNDYHQIGLHQWIYHYQC
jgi:hypothetical protein